MGFAKNCVLSNGCSSKQGEDLVIANLGDSRAVMGRVTENGIEAVQLTTDLKPGLPGKMSEIKD